MSEPTITVGVNSYVALEEANAIASERLFSTPWSAATEVTQIQALVTATALLDRMQWQGALLAPTQALAWPRVAERCPSGYPLATAIPEPIITATVELAIHLLKTGEMAGAPVMQRMLGDSLVMYFPSIADEFPKHVRRLIEPHLRA
ncbi:MAG: hypothetical protein EOO81_05140, partial [Oxalobacteraceae bacterium]